MLSKKYVTKRREAKDGCQNRRERGNDVIMYTNCQDEIECKNKLGTAGNGKR